MLIVAGWLENDYSMAEGEVKLVAGREWPEIQKRLEGLDFLNEMAKEIKGKLTGRL